MPSEIYNTPPSWIKHLSRYINPSTFCFLSFNHYIVFHPLLYSQFKTVYYLVILNTGPLNLSEIQITNSFCLCQFSLSDIYKSYCTMLDEETVREITERKYILLEIKLIFRISNTPTLKIEEGIIKKSKTQTRVFPSNMDSDRNRKNKLYKILKMK